MAPLRGAIGGSALNVLIILNFCCGNLCARSPMSRFTGVGFLRQGLSEPDFYFDLVYKLKKIVGSNSFSAQFIKIISHYKKIGYNINVLQQTASLVVNPITVCNFAFLLIARRWVGLQTL